MNHKTLRFFFTVIIFFFFLITVISCIFIPLFAHIDSGPFNKALALFSNLFSGILGIIIGHYFGKMKFGKEAITKWFGITVLVALFFFFAIGDLLIFWPVLTGYPENSIYTIITTISSKFGSLITIIIFAITTFIYS